MHINIWLLPKLASVNMQMYKIWSWAVAQIALAFSD